MLTMLFSLIKNIQIFYATANNIEQTWGSISYDINVIWKRVVPSEICQLGLFVLCRFCYVFWLRASRALSTSFAAEKTDRIMFSAV